MILFPDKINDINDLARTALSDSAMANGNVSVNPYTKVQLASGSGNGLFSFFPFATDSNVMTNVNPGAAPTPQKFFGYVSLSVLYTGATSGNIDFINALMANINLAGAVVQTYLPFGTINRNPDTGVAVVISTANLGFCFSSARPLLFNYLILSVSHNTTVGVSWQVSASFEGYKFVCN